MRMHGVHVCARVLGPRERRCYVGVHRGGAGECVAVARSCAFVSAAVAAAATLFTNYSADARCGALNARAECRIRAVAGGTAPRRSVWRVSGAYTGRLSRLAERESRRSHARREILVAFLGLFLLCIIFSMARRVVPDVGHPDAKRQNLADITGTRGYRVALGRRREPWLPRPLVMATPWRLSRGSRPHRERSPGGRWKY